MADYGSRQDDRLDAIAESDAEQIERSTRVKPGKRSRRVTRQSSVILANTGERVRRAVSLTNVSEPTEDSPLLYNGSSGTFDSLQPLQSKLHRAYRACKNFYYNQKFREIFKCVLAYFLASLGVYWTAFDNFLGLTDSKHVVATVAVYFHPARSKGSMHQTLLFVIASLTFSFSVSIGCRYVSTIFFNTGEDEISHVIDVVVSSIALAIIAFVKQSNNKVNSAFSLASITIVSCIVKESSINASNIPYERISATFDVVVVGCLICILICYFVFPISAVNELRNSLNDSYNIMSSVLSIVAHRFLAGEQLTEQDLKIVGDLKSNISELLSNNEEAMYELRAKGREREWLIYNELVSSTISLSRHLQALRSSAEIQWKLLNSGDNISSETATLDSGYDEGQRSQVSDSESHGHLFELFVSYLAPPMKSFIFTIKGVLAEIPFEKLIEERRFSRTTTLQKSLKTAIELFEAKQSDSLAKLYSTDAFKTSADFLFKTDSEEVAACCGNFASVLGLYAVELMEFLKLAETFEDEKTKPRSWSWLRFWSPSIVPHHDRSSSGKTTLNAALEDFQSQYGPQRSRPVKNQEKQVERVSFRVWSMLQVFRRTDIQFGIRVALGAFVLSSCAFLPQTKEIFISWRIEWALTVYCIMMNKSLGGTTMTVKWRFIGTFIGAFTAYITWITTDGNVYVLATTGALIAIPSFYIILYWKRNNAFGRFILLTYNLSALYSYSMTQKDSEDGGEGGDSPIVGEIAFHRFVAVSIGITWALTMASCFLPNSARIRLKNGLTVLWLRLGVIWSSGPFDYDPTDMKLIGMRDEEGTNRLLAECELLLKQAPVEFRLKGSFPLDEYTKLVKSTSKIIDSFQNMNSMIKVDPQLSPNESYVLKYIESERAELEHRIFLIFYMIASAMRLKFPLPSKPASTEHAKDRLLYKLSQIRTGSTDESRPTNEDFVLLYSYILVTSTIADELDILFAVIRDLLGDISEDIFRLV